MKYNHKSVINFGITPRIYPIGQLVVLTDTDSRRIGIIVNIVILPDATNQAISWPIVWWEGNSQALTTKPDRVKYYREDIQAAAMYVDMYEEKSDI